MNPEKSISNISSFNMVQGHYEHTGSTVAKFVMDDFDNQLGQFVKVFPKDYNKALAAKKQTVKVQ